MKVFENYSKFYRASLKMKSAMLLLSILIMFHYIIVSFDIQILITIFILTIEHEKIRYILWKHDIMWFFYIFIVFLLGISRSTDKLLVFKGVFFMCFCVIIKMTLQEIKTDYEDMLYKWLLFFGILHSLAVIIQVFFPLIIMKINLVILPSEALESLFLVTENTIYHAGITSQEAIAGFNICIAICISIVDLLSSKKIKHVIFLTVEIIGLLLTGKRTFFIAMFFCFIIIYFLYYAFIQGKTYKVLKTIILLCIFLYIGYLIPSLRDNVLRIFNQDLSGREYIYLVLLDNIKSSPLLGVGMDSFYSQIYSKLGLIISPHNEYLKVLCDVGFLGFLPFLFAIFYPIYFMLLNIKTYGKTIYVSTDQHLKKALYLALGSLFFQMLVAIYAMTGNPFSEKQQLLSYFIFTSIGLRSVRFIRKYNSNLLDTI